MTAIRLERSSPMPLWAQLEQELRRRLHAGDFESSFPTDLELTDEYDVSRNTVREAVRRLQWDGLVERRRGRGTTVVGPVFEQPLGSLYSLFASIEEQGVEQRSEVVRLELVRDADPAASLSLPADTELVLLERVRYADGDPLALERAWLPAARAEPLLDADFGHTALYDELEQRCGFRPNGGWERIGPAVPTKSERRRLGVGDDEAVFSIERLGAYGGEPVEWRESIVRGDRYRFVVEWSQAGAEGVRFSANL